MKRLAYLELISDLFSFKTIFDESYNEYVLFKNNCLEDISNINDKTSFEAVENHVHLFDKVRKKDLKILSSIAKKLGNALLCSLKYAFPDKDFVVFTSITLGDTMIIRFHQKWSGEEYYYTDLAFQNSQEKIYMFET